MKVERFGRRFPSLVVCALAGSLIASSPTVQAQSSLDDPPPVLRRHNFRSTAQIYLLNAIPEGPAVRDLSLDWNRLGPVDDLEAGDGELLHWVEPVAAIGERRMPRRIAELRVEGRGLRARGVARLQSGQAYCAVLHLDARGGSRLSWRWLGTEMHSTVIEHRCERLARELSGG